MTAKRILFSVLCVLLTVVIIMTGVIIGKVSQLVSSLAGPDETKPVASTTSPQPSTTLPADTEPTPPTVPDTTTLPTEPGHVHDYVLTETVEATCENYGYAIYTCSGCGKQDIPYEEQVKPYGHNYGAGEVIDATCTADGGTCYTCSRCGKTEMRNVQTATGHSLEYVLSVTASCESAGFDLYRCTVCGEEIVMNEVEQGAHDYQVISRVEPTCRSGGYEMVRCSICGDEIRTELPSSGHAYSEWTLCDDDSLSRSCAVCGASQSTLDLVITRTQVSVSGINGEHLKVYVIYLGTAADPELFCFTVYDTLDNGTLAYECSGTQGLLLHYTNANGEQITKQAYFSVTSPIVIA